MNVVCYIKEKSTLIQIALFPQTFYFASKNIQNTFKYTAHNLEEILLYSERRYKQIFFFSICTFPATAASLSVDEPLSSL